MEKRIKELEKKIVNGKEALDWMISQIRDELKCEPENLNIDKIRREEKDMNNEPTLMAMLFAFRALEADDPDIFGVWMADTKMLLKGKLGDKNCLEIDGIIATFLAMLEMLEARMLSLKYGKSEREYSGKIQEAFGNRITEVYETD